MYEFVSLRGSRNLSLTCLPRTQKGYQFGVASNLLLASFWANTVISRLPTGTFLKHSTILCSVYLRPVFSLRDGDIGAVFVLVRAVWYEVYPTPNLVPRIACVPRKTLHKHTCLQKIWGDVICLWRVNGLGWAYVKFFSTHRMSWTDLIILRALYIDSPRTDTSTSWKTLYWPVRC